MNHGGESQGQAQGGGCHGSHDDLEQLSPRESVPSSGHGADRPGFPQLQQGHAPAAESGCSGRCEEFFGVFFNQSTVMTLN